MRIAIITQDDAFYIGRFFKVFLEGIDDTFDIRTAVVCRTMGKAPQKLAAQLLGFYGPVDFTRMMLRYGTTKLLAATLGNLSRNRAYTLTQMFRKHDVPVIQARNVNARSLREKLAAEELDLIVSVAAPQIFKAPLLELPRVACINVHTARLPQYRGMMPNFWVLYHGDTHSAITVHTMVPEIDRGQILLQREFPIDPQESLDRLIKRTKELGAECVLETLRNVARRGIEAVEPPDVEGSYFTFPTTEQVREFRRAGKRLL